jgi:hypothetical protein
LTSSPPTGSAELAKQREGPDVSEATEKKLRPRKAREPLFVNHRDIAHDLGITPKCIRRWVDAGKFPLPHSHAGTFLLWRRPDYNHFVKTGLWPHHMKMIAKMW